MGIKHTDVKVSGEKGFAAEWNKNHVIDGDVDMSQNSWENQVIENLGAFPGGPVEGQIVWRSDLNKLYIWNGAAWEDFAQHTFNTDDFTVAALAVSLKNKTSYWSMPGNAWIPINPNVDDVLIQTNHVDANTDGQTFVAPVFLPHGVVVTAVIVNGDAGATAETWTMYRTARDSTATTTMASANFDTEDNTITAATIDNENYTYSLRSSTLDTGDSIHGTRITYTTDYD